MRKFYIVMLLFVTTMALAQQKMTIKTSNGKTVEISCDGMMPTEIHVEGDKVIFKMNNIVKTETTNAADIDSIDTFALVEDSVATSVESVDSLQNTPDSIKVNEFTGSSQSTIGFIADALVGEIVPEYNQITREHANDNPRSEKEVVEKFAKNFVSEDVVETADFFGTIFKGLRFTKDSSFVAKYEQRKPKKSWRGYNIIELDGSFGQNIDQLSSSVSNRINADDYGDDTKNEKKFGAGIKYSRVYMPGSELNGKWKPNPVGFAVSWGGLLSYSYEKDMGSYVSAMGKAGIQIGHDIAIGADALVGCGITPYNTFYTNGINFSMLNKSAFCFKYGVQLWGSLNFSKNTYTAIYGRYIRSAKPSSSFSDLPQDWEVVLEDFDPSSWSVGLAVGYKFGAPQELSCDKRLQAGVTTGYQFIGKQKGVLISAAIERLTKVSPSTSLSYGLSVDQLFEQEKNKKNCFSLLFSAGFTVNQPNKRWLWGANLYAGLGEYNIGFAGQKYEYTFENCSKKLCGKGALQLHGGYKLGKLSEIFTACRLGYHFGGATECEGLDDTKFVNLNGFEADWRLGYRFTF